MVIVQPLPGNRNDGKAWELSGTEAVVGRTPVVVDGGYRDTGLVIPHRRERGWSALSAWKGRRTTSSTITSVPASSTPAPR